MKVILIDEDTNVLEHLATQLNKLAPLEIIGIYTNPVMAREAVKRTDIDLVFLAIGISEIDGMKLTEQIKQIKPELPIVLVANDSEHAVKAFEINAFDYIVKPVKRERLKLTIERVNQQNKPTKQMKKTNSIQLNLFGRLSIIKHGKYKKETIFLNWRTKKAEQLFLFLLHHQGNLIDKTKITETLWQDIEIERAYEQLYVTIYHIRKALEPLEEYITIKSKLGCYELRLDNVEVDTRQFDLLYINKSPLSAENIKMYEAALTINKGVLLNKYDYIWLEASRQRYEVQWLQMASHVMNYYEKHNKFYKGINLATSVCERFPLEEIGYFYLMKYNAQNERTTDVKEIYDELVNITWKELQTYPSKQVITWYNDWVRSKTQVTLEIEGVPG